ncbi:MAG: hypothetical protein ACI4PQ_07700 [Butyricicoccaceae bacterium]
MPEWLKVILLWSLFVFPKITTLMWVSFSGETNRLLELGRSKSGYRKLMNSLSLWDKVSKRRYVELTVHEGKKYQRYFVVVYYCGWICVCCAGLIFFCSHYIPKEYVEAVWDIFFILKCYLIEFPYIIFSVLHLRRPPDKRGNEWDFIMEYKKRRGWYRKNWK